MKTGDTGRVLELTTCFAGLAIWSWRTSRHLGTVQPYGGRKCTTEEECKPPFCRPNMTTFTMTETNEWENEKWRGQKCPSNGIKSCPSAQFVFIGTDFFLYISLRLSFLSCISCLIKHFNKRALINLFFLYSATCFSLNSALATISSMTLQLRSVVVWHFKGISVPASVPHLKRMIVEHSEDWWETKSPSTILPEESVSSSEWLGE